VSLSLKSDRQQAEDGHIEAELCDRRIAEQLFEPAQTQDRTKSEEDGERCHRISDEGRDEDVADDQLENECIMTPSPRQAGPRVSRRR
jgi:hypothetical protein